MKKILIDTDCGVDDAIAIMMALASNRVDLVGITTVSGNTYVNQVTDNVLRLLTYLGRGDVPVFKGAHVPLVAKPHTGERIHGKNGLGDVELPGTEKREEKMSAPEAIFEMARNNPGITVVTIGPLTNVAMALNLFPELKKLVSGIVSMGGALYTGNVTRFAEFNFFFDPEAAQFVFESGIPMSIVPWDPIVKEPFGEEELRKVFSSPSASVSSNGEGEKKARSGGDENPSGRAVKFFFDVQQVTMGHIEKFYGVRATMLPDPAAMAYVIEETAAKQKIRGSLRMELNYNTLRGASVLGDGHGMEIVTEIDRDVLLGLLAGISRLG